jgi:Rieske Fe-S protein
MSQISNPGRFGCLECTCFGGHYIASRALGWFTGSAPAALIIAPAELHGFYNAGACDEGGKGKLPTC